MARCSLGFSMGPQLEREHFELRAGSQVHRPEPASRRKWPGVHVYNRRKRVSVAVLDVEPGAFYRDSPTKTAELLLQRPRAGQPRVYSVDAFEMSGIRTGERTSISGTMAALVFSGQI